jgi:two-component system sensor histidine kinase TctE
MCARSPEDLTPLEFDHVPVEVRPLVDAVNLHVSRSDAMAQAQAQFIADAAHQLRTPLAILKTQAEFAQRQLDTFGGEGAAHSGAAEAVGGIVKQLEQAARMTNQLLALARVRQHAPDGTAPATEVEIIDAIGVAEQVALDYLPLARGRQQDLAGNDRPDWNCQCRPIRAVARGIRQSCPQRHPVLGTPQPHHALRRTGRRQRHARRRG